MNEIFVLNFYSLEEGSADTLAFLHKLCLVFTAILNHLGKLRILVLSLLNLVFDLGQLGSTHWLTVDLRLSFEHLSFKSQAFLPNLNYLVLNLTEQLSFVCYCLILVLDLLVLQSYLVLELGHLSS